MPSNMRTEIKTVNLPTSEGVPAPVTRCALYLRVSTDNQISDEGSIKSQEQRLRDVVRSRSSVQSPWEVVRVFKDEGKSGGSTEGRDEYQEMLLGVRFHKFDVIVCTEIARISRKLKDFIAFTDLLKEYDTKFIAISQAGIDTTAGPMGEMMMNLLAVLAEAEREWSRQRTSANLIARLRRGVYNGGGRMYGYIPDKKVDGGLRVHPEQATIVRFLYDEYLKGKSLRELQVILKEKGILIPEYISRRERHHAQRAWKVVHIRRVLRSPFYIAACEVTFRSQIRERAKLAHKKEWYQMKWEPIIDRPTWDAVQKRLSEGSRGGYVPKKGRDFEYLLGQLVTCGHCGIALQGAFGRSNKKAHKHFYYRHPRGTQKEDCKLRSYVSAKRLEGMVMDRIDELARNKELMARLVDEANKDSRQHIDDLKRRISVKEAEVRKHGETRNGIIDNIAKFTENEGADAMKRRLVEIASWISGCENDLKSLRQSLAESSDATINADEMALVLALSSKLMGKVPASLKRDILKVALTSATIYPDRFEILFFGDRKWIARNLAGLERGSRMLSDSKFSTPALLDWRAEMAPRGGFEPPTN
jgi:site-specific DNA recombinase